MGEPGESDVFAPALMTASGRLHVGELAQAKSPLDLQGATMASKDKGGRSTKTAASKSPKEKRQAKKDKKSGKSG